MRRNGFTLVELIVVIGVATTLLAISGLYFNGMYHKNRIERQMKEMYADLMGARTQALYQKTPRTVTLVSSTQYTVNPWQQDAGGVSTLQKTVSYPIVFNPAGAFTFDARGMASATLAVCVEPSGNPGFVDSILISATNVALGKRNQGGDCVTSQIVVQ